MGWLGVVVGGQPGGRGGSGGPVWRWVQVIQREAGSEKGTWRGSCRCSQRQPPEGVVTPGLKLQGCGTFRWAVPSEGFCDRGRRCGQVLGGVGCPRPLGAWRRAPQASVSRGGVTGETCQASLLPHKDANSTGMPAPHSCPESVDLGTLLPTCSLYPRSYLDAGRAGAVLCWLLGRGLRQSEPWAQGPTRPLCSPLLALIWGCGGKITSFLGR